MDQLTYQGFTAWMIRRDGSIFPVVQHIYGNPEDVEETLFAAEWLYERTRRSQTRKESKHSSGCGGCSSRRKQTVKSERTGFTTG